MSSKVKVSTVKLNNGKEMPMVGLGTWKSEPNEALQVIGDAIDVGYRHFDCALYYENEREIGQGLRAKIDQGVVTREELFITSKLWNTFHRPEQVVAACKTSIENLGVGYLDLYLIHWPMGFKEGGALMPTNEAGEVQYSDADFLPLWPQMEECVAQGLARAIGVSNFNSKQLQRVLDVAKIKPAVNQVESHPWLNQSKLLTFCFDLGIVVTAYGPLGSPYRPLPKPDDIPLLEEPKLKDVAAKHGKSTAQVALRYQVQRGVVVIPKSIKKTRLSENLNIFDFELSPQDMAAVESLDCNGRLCSLDVLKTHPHYPFHLEF